ncbi:MAG: hypothetical protein KIT19_03725 [Phycisphaeraceae bacterium]|nr:hypothetical protein [Phycisphaeraceae bacterium]
MQNSSTLRTSRASLLARQHTLHTLIAIAITLAAPVVALADDFVNRVNQPFRAIRTELRSDSVLLPVIARMAAPPVGVDRLDRARIIPAGSQSWAAAETWAQGDSQQAVLRAIHQVTQEPDYRIAFGFGQPYGAQGVPASQIRDRLYTDLGDPPLLSAARHHYLPAFERVACLVNVEATRLAAAGDPNAAIDLLIDWVFFCRQIADREFAVEVIWAMQEMSRSFERVRDVAYVDSLASSPTLSADRMKAVIDRLEERGFLGIERIALPLADTIGAEQVIARVYVERAGINKATFGSTLARLGSSDRPLRLFGEAAKWDVIADRQKTWFDIRDTLTKITNDWTSRWMLDAFDPRMTQAFEYRSLDASSSVIQATVPDLSEIFALRQVLRTEAVATRHALAVYCAKVSGGQWPPTLAAVRPIWIQQLEIDPFNPRRERGARPPLEYFVPIRDTRSQFGDREVPRPHDISIVTSGQNFSRQIDDSQFILYSVGGNGGKDWARRVQNTADNIANADYLAWPPILSLQRQHMADSGQLK